MTHDQRDAHHRLEDARRLSNHHARRAQASNDRHARAVEAAAKAETERNQAHADSYAASKEHEAALAHAIRLGYRHTHRIDATQEDDWNSPTLYSPAYFAEEQANRDHEEQRRAQTSR